MSSVVNSKKITRSHFFGLDETGTNLVAYDFDLVLQADSSFATGLEKIDLISYREDLDQFLIYSSQNFSLFSMEGDKLTSSRFFTSSQDSKTYLNPSATFVCDFDSKTAKIQNVLNDTQVLVIPSSESGMEIIDCDVKPNGNDVLIIEGSPESQTINLNLVEISTGIKFPQNQIKYKAKKNYVIQHGFWVSNTKFLMLFSENNVPVSFQYIQVYPMYFELKTPSGNVRLVNATALKNDWIIGWNTVKKRYEAFSEKLVAQQQFQWNIFENWETGGLCAADTSRKKLAILNPKEGYFQSWDLETVFMLDDVKENGRANLISQAEETGDQKLLVIPYGTDVIEFNKGSLEVLFRKDCRFLKNYVFALKRNFIWTDKWGQSILMVGSNEDSILLYKDMDFCIEADFSAVSTGGPKDMIKEIVPNFFTRHYVVNNLHGHIASIPHTFNADNIKHQPWTTWALLVPYTAKYELKIIDFTREYTFAAICTLETVTPLYYKWAYRSTDVITISSSSKNVEVFLVIKPSESPSCLLSSSITTPSGLSGTPSQVFPLTASSFVATTIGSSHVILIMDYITSSNVVQLNPTYLFSSNGVSYNSIARSIDNASQLIVVGSIGMMIFGGFCGNVLSASSEINCHASCKTCSGPSSFSCLSCYGQMTLHGGACRRPCWENGQYMKEKIHMCSANCWPLSSAPISTTNKICVLYQETCEGTVLPGEPLWTPEWPGSGSQKYWDGTPKTCLGKCQSEAEKFFWIDQTCGVDNYQDFEDQEYHDGFEFGGVEMCKKVGALSVDLHCEFLETCFSDGLVNTGVDPYCELDCTSVNNGKAYFRYYEPNSNTCYNENECPPAFPFNIVADYSCQSDCPDKYIKLILGDVRKCFGTDNTLGCGGVSLYRDNQNSVCVFDGQCPPDFSVVDLGRGACGSDGDKRSDNYLDSVNGYLVGAPLNCVYGRKLYSLASTFECISIDQCEAITNFVKLSTRSCVYPSQCPGSRSYGVCCDFTSNYGCSFDGKTECSKLCLPFACYGSQKTQCCHVSCTTCSGPTFSDCTSCVGTYGVSEEGVCCDRSCRTCDGPTMFNCTTCIDHFYINLEDTSCDRCHSSCFNCFNGTNFDCLSCYPDYYHHSSDNHCDKNCFSEESMFASDFSCSPCDKSCLTCSGKSSFNCLSCKNKQFLTPKGSCSDSCPKDYYTNTIDYVCIYLTDCKNLNRFPYIRDSGDRDCSESCHDFIEATLNKTEVCFESCPASHPNIENSVSEESGDAIVRCVASCSPGHFLYEGECLKGSCPFNWAPDPQNICTKCVGDCVGCDGVRCETCNTETSVGRYIPVGGECQAPKCETEKYLDPKTSSCVPCAGDASCIYCHYDPFNTTSFCTGCKSGYLLYQYICYPCGLSILYPNEEKVPLQWDVSNKKCLEVCGDGVRFQKSDFDFEVSVVECDDGNEVNGDGCDKSCNVEEDWKCEGGSKNSKDTCKRTTGPIAYLEDMTEIGDVITIGFTQAMNTDFDPMAFTNFTIAYQPSEDYSATISWISEVSLQVELEIYTSMVEPLAQLSFDEASFVSQENGKPLREKTLTLSLPDFFGYSKAESKFVKGVGYLFGGILGAILLVVLPLVIGSPSAGVNSMGFMASFCYLAFISDPTPKNLQDFLFSIWTLLPIHFLPSIFDGITTRISENETRLLGTFSEELDEMNPAKFTMMSTSPLFFQSCGTLLIILVAIYFASAMFVGFSRLDSFKKNKILPAILQFVKWNLFFLIGDLFYPFFVFSVFVQARHSNFSHIWFSVNTIAAYVLGAFLVTYPILQYSLARREIGQNESPEAFESFKKSISYLLNPRDINDKRFFPQVMKPIRNILTLFQLVPIAVLEVSSLTQIITVCVLSLPIFLALVIGRQIHSVTVFSGLFLVSLVILLLMHFFPGFLKFGSYMIALVVVVLVIFEIAMLITDVLFKIKMLKKAAEEKKEKERAEAARVQALEEEEKRNKKVYVPKLKKRVRVRQEDLEREEEEIKSIEGSEKPGETIENPGDLNDSASSFLENNNNNNRNLD